MTPQDRDRVIVEARRQSERDGWEAKVAVCFRDAYERQLVGGRPPQSGIDLTGTADQLRERAEEIAETEEQRDRLLSTVEEYRERAANAALEDGGQA